MLRHRTTGNVAWSRAEERGRGPEGARKRRKPFQAGQSWMEKPATRWCSSECSAAIKLDRGSGERSGVSL